MKISPLYELLIYIEDREKVQIDELQKWGKNASRGILGKMEAMKLITKNKSEDSSQILLSDKGHKFLNSILDAIHRPVMHWDGKWRLVWFSIPESMRPIRDKFRRSLEGLGMKPILNSLWISPMDISSEIEREIVHHKVGNKVLFLETDQVKGITTEKILEAWDFEKIRQYFVDFIESSEIKLKSSTLDSFELKKLIFEYALILNNEPYLPIELLPKDWPKFRATMQYKKVKRTLLK